MTQTRATLAVPAPSPETSLSLGEAWTGTDWNSAGLCVNTDGRVWLEASGESGSSTLSALSNGGAGIGQLLMQSLSTNLYLFSAESNVVAATGSVLIAGGEGVKIVGGQGAARVFGLAGSAALKSVAPDDADPASDHASAYVEYMEDVADQWAIADASLGVAMIVLESVLQIAGLRASGTSGAASAAAFALASAAQLAGGATDMARLGGGEVPTLNLASWSDVNLNTTGFASFYAGVAMVLAGLRADALGFVDATVTGGLGASLKSGYSSIEGRSLDLTAGVDLTAASLLGELKLYGSTIYVGALGTEASGQLPTTAIKASAVGSIDVHSRLGGIEQLSSGSITYDADRVLVSAAAAVILKSPTYEVKVSVAGIEIALLRSVKVSTTAMAVSANMQGVTKLQLEATGVQIGTPAASLKCDGAGSWILSGAQVTFL